MITAKLIGTLEGVIWMPAVVCQKDIVVDLTAERRRLTAPRAGSLHHMASGIVSDGDFRRCRLLPESVIEVTSTTHSASSGRVVKHTRTKVFSVADFPSIADCVGFED